MPGIKIVFLISLTFVCSQRFPNCRTTYSYSKTCNHYKFGQNCQPWSLGGCETIKRTFNDPKCPRYNCVSINFLH